MGLPNGETVLSSIKDLKGREIINWACVFSCPKRHPPSPWIFKVLIEIRRRKLNVIERNKKIFKQKYSKKKEKNCLAPLIENTAVKLKSLFFMPVLL